MAGNSQQLATQIEGKTCHRADRIARLIGCGIALLASALPLAAQVPTSRPETQLARALAAPFGQASLDAMTEALQSASDRQCRTTKNVTDAQIRRQAETILLRFGAILIANWERGYKPQQTVVDLFTAAGDYKALAEYRRILAHPDMEIRNIARQPSEDATLVDDIAVRFERYVTVAKLPIGSFSYLSTGNELLGKIQTDLEGASIEVEDRTEYLAKELFAVLEPYSQLLQQRLDAVAKANAEDYKLFAGVETMLGEVCIAAK